MTTYPNAANVRDLLQRVKRFGWHALVRPDGVLEIDPRGENRPVLTGETAPASEPKSGSGRLCTVCADPRRSEIDGAIAARESVRNIAKRFGPSASAVYRHRPHVRQALVRASERRGERLEETLLQKCERLEGDARRLGERAEAEGDLRCAIAANHQLLDCLRFLREVVTGIPSSQVSIVLRWSDDAAIPSPPIEARVLAAVEGATGEDGRATFASAPRSGAGAPDVGDPAVEAPTGDVEEAASQEGP